MGRRVGERESDRMTDTEERWDCPEEPETDVKTSKGKMDPVIEREKEEWAPAAVISPSSPLLWQQLPESCPFAEKCQAHRIPPATQRPSLVSAAQAQSDKG